MHITLMVPIRICASSMMYHSLRLRVRSAKSSNVSRTPNHSPVLLTFGVTIPVIQSIPLSRWNFQKANWDKFAKRLDDSISGIVPKPENYNQFMNSVSSAARKAIPRGYRKSYIPGWDETCTNLYDLFCSTGDRDAEDALIQRLNDNCAKIWHAKTDSLNFTHSSCKDWNVIQKLGINRKAYCKKSYPVTANDITSKLLENSKADVSASRRKNVERELCTVWL